MRILSNKVSGIDISNLFYALKQSGLIGSSVQIDSDKTRFFNPRKAKFGTEIQLGSPTNEKFLLPDFKEFGTDMGYNYSDKAVRAASVRRSRNMGYGGARFDYLRYGATWFEYGVLIAAIYLLDPDAQVGYYKDQESFEYETNGYDRPWQYADYHMQKDGRVFDFMEYVRTKIPN